MNSSSKKIIVAAAVIIRAGEVLITSRTEKETGKVFWEFPGGKLEDGETLGSALNREMSEELGVDTMVLDIMYNIEHDYPDKSVDLYFFRCLFTEEYPRLHSHDGQLIKWVSVKDLCKENLLPADAPLAAYLERFA